jgi:hypothetical protein
MKELTSVTGHVIVVSTFWRTQKSRGFLLFHLRSKEIHFPKCCILQNSTGWTKYTNSENLTYLDMDRICFAELNECVGGRPSRPLHRDLSGLLCLVLPSYFYSFQ